ncbi:MAG: hypothetical protein LBT90_02540 [Holosporaceae bacterium]|nr:hypothetical protein [Holosporaceae bacterium]
MRNYVLLFTVIMVFFSAEHTQAMLLPIYSHFANGQFPDHSLRKLYAGMENGKICWEKTAARDKREEFWPFLYCMNDGRVETTFAFSEDGCPITTENTAKVILEYFRSGRYLTEGAGYSERLFAKLSVPEEERAKKIIKANLVPQIDLINVLRAKKSENTSTQWLLTTIMDDEDIPPNRNVGKSMKFPFENAVWKDAL